VSNKEKSDAALKGELGLAKKIWHSVGRGGKTAIVAVAVAIPATIIAGVVGLFRGVNKTNDALNQFNEITNENKNLKEKLTTSEANIAQIKSVVAQVEKPVEKNHVAALEAGRSQQNSQAAAL